MNPFTAIFAACAAVFNWLTLRSSPGAVARRDAENLQKTKQDIAREVQAHDKDKVNARMQDLLKCFAVLLVVTCTGCISKPYPVYVPGNEAMYPLDMFTTICLAREKVEAVQAKTDEQKRVKGIALQKMEEAHAATSLLPRDEPSGWFVPDPLMVRIQEKLAERQMLLKQGVK